jgi:hypothetical protein
MPGNHQERRRFMTAAGERAVATTARRLGHHALNLYRRFSAWFLIYAAIGGALGFVVVGRNLADFDHPTCLPFLGYMAVIDSACPNDLVNIFWFAALGLPRLIVLCVALNILTLIYLTHSWLGIR